MQVIVKSYHEIVTVHSIKRGHISCTIDNIFSCIEVCRELDFEAWAMKSAPKILRESCWIRKVHCRKSKYTGVSCINLSSWVKQVLFLWKYKYLKNEKTPSTYKIYTRIWLVPQQDMQAWLRSRITKRREIEKALWSSPTFTFADDYWKEMIRDNKMLLYVPNNHNTPNPEKTLHIYTISSSNSSAYSYSISLEKYCSNSWSMVGFLVPDWASADKIRKLFLNIVNDKIKNPQLDLENSNIDLRKKMECSEFHKRALSK